MPGLGTISGMRESMIDTMVSELIAHEQAIQIGDDAVWGEVMTLDNFAAKSLPVSVSPTLIIGQQLPKFEQRTDEAYFTQGLIDLDFLIYIQIPPFVLGELRTDIYQIRNKITTFLLDTLIDARFPDAPYAFAFQEDKFYPWKGQYAQPIMRSASDSKSRASFLGKSLNDPWYEIEMAVTFYFNNRVGA